jgi:hypothetical protein
MNPTKYLNDSEFQGLILNWYKPEGFIRKKLKEGEVRCIRPDDGGASTSETSVNFYETTRRNIPEEVILVNSLFL